MIFANPYSGAIGDTASEARHLLYVPTDINDPLVTWSDGTANDFFAWTDKAGFARGAVVGKGSLDQAWQSDMDIRIQQEIPFFGDAKGKLYIDIENVLNMISDSNGTKTYINTTDILSAVGIVEADIDPATGTYVYSGFEEPRTTPDSFDSLWRIQVGVRVDF